MAPRWALLRGSHADPRFVRLTPILPLSRALIELTRDIFYIQVDVVEVSYIHVQRSIWRNYRPVPFYKWRIPRLCLKIWCFYLVNARPENKVPL
jgi:hypothetical protein